METPVRSVRADVMMAPLVKGQAALISLQVMSLLVLEVLVQVVVVEVEGVLLSSLSSTPTQATHPRTRPAARGWAWGAKGLGCLLVLPAPGPRCSGPFS